MSGRDTLRGGLGAAALAALVVLGTGLHAQRSSGSPGTAQPQLSQQPAAQAPAQPAPAAQPPAPVPRAQAEGQQLPAPAVPPAPTQKPTPSFRTGVEVVSLNVTVLNGENRFVTDLEQDEFLVFEDGAKQEVTFFTRSQLPIALSILLDTSASMEDKMATAQEAAVGFARRLRQEDQAQVIDFDSRVSILQQFTNDAAALTKAIRSTAAGARRRCTTPSTSR